MDKKPTQEMYVDVSENEQEKEQVVEKGVSASAPLNIVDLPSCGRLGYPTTVEYREVLVKDEEVLASATSKTYARTLNGVLKSILNDCEFYEKLTVHDRDFLLVWIWANNYSPTKRVSFTCPKCKTTSDQTVDFSAQNITEINERFKGHFDMPIKKIGSTVRVRLNTVADEIEAETYLAANPNANYENLLIALSIDLGFEGIPMDQRLKTIRENFSGAEMSKIKQFHIKMRYGIDPDVEYVCKNTECGEVTKDAFPFHTEDILFPTIQTDIEEFL